MTQTTRACLDCSADIGHRHGNTKRCEPCSAAHQKRQGSKNVDESTHCVDRRDGEVCTAGKLRRSRCGKHYKRAVKAGADLTPKARCCPSCDVTFRPAQEDAVHCSRRCTSTASNRRNYVSNAERACVECGAFFVPTRSDRIVCSRRCRMRRGYLSRVKCVRDFICAHCAGVFQAVRCDAAYCSPQCSKRGYYASNRARLIARSVQWAIENPDRMQARRRERRARKRGNPGSVGVQVQDWLRLVNRHSHCCAYCGSYAAVLHMDHVIPLAKGGRHAIGNVLPACPTCNHSKGATFLFQWKRTMVSAPA